MKQSLEDAGWVRKNLGRLVFVAVVILVILGWKLYASLNDDGLITGRVIDPNGEPVAGATVRIQEHTINLLKPPVTATTGPDGRFTYEEMAIIEFVATAVKEGYRDSPQKRHHLYFKGQNYEFPEPIVLEPLESSSD